uniref:Uncharacterized protein n=1 Tax=Anguilla anguilla TaxID=7936 RepID=A0A0E9TJ81_ANGAN
MLFIIQRLHPHDILDI